jgi:hypothetical protein
LERFSFHAHPRFWWALKSAIRAALKPSTFHQRGGTPSPEVTKRTKLLIVRALLDAACPSNKLSRATNFGNPVVSERRFLEWIGKSASDIDQKTYSADQLAALSKMSIAMTRELSQLSLLDERDRCFGFRDHNFRVSLCGLQWKPKDR